jgi:hypothetical protein
MLTQIDIEDALHKKAKQHAVNHGTTLKALVNEGLSELLKRKQAKTGNPLRLRKGESV